MSKQDLNDAKDGGKFILFVVVLFLALGAAGAFAYRTFGAFNEETRRGVVEESKSFRDGTIRQLRDYQARYAEATTPEAKGALRALVFQELNSFSEDDLPADLTAFVADLRAGK